MSPPQFRIVIDDGIPYADPAFAGLGTITRLPGREISRADLMQADALVVRTVTSVDAALLEGTPVKFVGSCTIGIDHLDTGWLESAGVRWCHAPGCNANAVAEYVLAAMAAVDGVLPGLIAGSGRLGLIGFGNVGRRVWQRCAALGIEVIAYDPFLDAGQCPVQVDLSDVLECGVVSIHTPLTTGGRYPTRHLLSAQQLGQLPAGALVINSSRGGVLANAALNELLHLRPDIRLVLDVWENEPDIDTALAQAVTLGTPHIAGYSREGKLAGTTMVAAQLAEFLGRPVALLKADAGAATVIELQGPVSLNQGDLIQRLVRCLYDIKADHAMFRQQFASGISGWFENFRRSYQPRPEWAGLSVAAANDELQLLIDQLMPELTGADQRL